MSRKIKNLIGRKYGRLTVIEMTNKRKRKYVVWKCLCKCGNYLEVASGDLPKTKSCGCIFKEKITRHGHTKNHRSSRTYKSWEAMKARCYNTSHHKYEIYGGRGIFVCRRWRNSFDNFLADLGERPIGKTLDRINGNGPYAPYNCKWSTPLEQRHNRSISR